MRRLDCGQQHHFIGECRFHLATFIGNRLVSTVGDYWRSDRTRDTVGLGRYYETYVFQTDDDWSVKGEGDEQWAHPHVTDWSELEGHASQTAMEATETHWRVVAALTGEEEE